MNYEFITGEKNDREEEEARLFFVALTRGRDRIYLFTWKDRESTYIPEPPNISSFFKGYPLMEPHTYYIRGTIDKTTEKAYLVTVSLPHHEEGEVWIPKSVVTFHSEEEETGKTCIGVKTWWVEKNFTNPHMPRGKN